MYKRISRPNQFGIVIKYLSIHLLDKKLTMVRSPAPALQSLRWCDIQTVPKCQFRSPHCRGTVVEIQGSSQPLVPVAVTGPLTCCSSEATTPRWVLNLTLQLQLFNETVRKLGDQLKWLKEKALKEKRVDRNEMEFGHHWLKTSLRDYKLQECFHWKIEESLIGHECPKTPSKDYNSKEPFRWKIQINLIKWRDTLNINFGHNNCVDRTMDSLWFEDHKFLRGRKFDTNQ